MFAKKLSYKDIFNYIDNKSLAPHADFCNIARDSDGWYLALEENCYIILYNRNKIDLFIIDLGCQNVHIFDDKFIMSHELKFLLFIKGYSIYDKSKNKCVQIQ